MPGFSNVNSCDLRMETASSSSLKEGRWFGIDPLFGFFNFQDGRAKGRGIRGPGGTYGREFESSIEVSSLIAEGFEDSSVGVDISFM
jgi:hypothetical protein